MANSYTQLYVQLVFAVKYREALLKKEWREELFKYITGIVQSHRHKMIIINGVEDHVHLFVSMNPNQSVSDLVREVKRSSAIWLNKNKYKKARFQWQKGYGAFSYSQSQSERVINYINNQEEHHKKVSMQEEFKSFLKKYGISFRDEYLLQEPEKRTESNN